MELDFQSWNPNEPCDRGVVREWVGKLWQTTEDVAALQPNPTHGGVWILTNMSDITDRLMKSLV